jgi:hypothetical protein
MSIATVLRVFKNSSLITEQGEFKISRVFDNGRAANKAGIIITVPKMASSFIPASPIGGIQVCRNRQITRVPAYAGVF